MSEPRIPLPGPQDMNAAQRAVFDKIVSGPRRTLVGPLRAALHNPSLADRWQALGQVLRYETCLPTVLNELAILVTARHWNSELEWTIHAGEARTAGLDICPHSLSRTSERSTSSAVSCLKTAVSAMPPIRPCSLGGASWAWSN